MRETRKNNKRSHNVTLKQGKKIVKQLINKTADDALDEFERLRKVSCARAKKESARTSLGNGIVDAFTLVERLHAKGDQGVNFYEFWNKRNMYKKKPYVKKMLKFYETRDISEIRKMRYIHTLYFSSIAIFRPIMAMEIYCRTKAKRVLDFTMGWGGRLVGACALNLEAYYGIDINIHLKQPYEELIQTIKKAPDVHTQIDVRFEDALKVDYSKMDYDTVFTSPPYYNVEQYRIANEKQRSEETWNNEFYKPIIERTFAHLKKNGRYCLNVPEKIYKEVCIGILGKYSNRILLKKESRHHNETKDQYKEYIYVWIKKE
jgi:16S rRNA G966 N2-methylase RsmD